MATLLPRTKTPERNDIDMTEYEIPVRFSGRVTYIVRAKSAEEAKELAGKLAEEEDRLGPLEDIDWDVRDPRAWYDD